MGRMSEIKTIYLLLYFIQNFSTFSNAQFGGLVMPQAQTIVIPTFDYSNCPWSTSKIGDGFCDDADTTNVPGMIINSLTNFL